MRRLFLTLIVTFTLAGCSLVDTLYREDSPTPQSPPQPLPPASSIAAVNTLLDQAETQVSQGKTEQAVSLMERALKIEPANAVIWHKLAAVRLLQQNWSQAEQLAAKSSSLPSRYPQLQQKNQQIIDQARSRRLRNPQ